MDHEDILSVYSEYSCVDAKIAGALDGATIIAFESDYVDYEGYAELVFEKDGKLFWNSSSHCSCYGHEGQFDPGEVDRAFLENYVKAFENRDKADSYGYHPIRMTQSVVDEIKKYLAQ